MSPGGFGDEEKCGYLQNVEIIGGPMRKCGKPNIVYGVSSVLWGILGFYVSNVFVIDIIAELHTNIAYSDINAESHTNIALFVGLDILLVLCGVGLLLSTIMIWSRIRHVRKTACIISLVSSLVILMNFVWLAVANPLSTLDTWITILVPLVSILLSILSWVCIPHHSTSAV